VSAPLTFVARHRFFIALMTAAICEQAAATVARVGTSYRGIEFDVSIVIIGLITASYSLVPIFFGVKAGRYVDQGHDSRLARFGTAAMALACIGLIFSRDWIGLFVFNTLLGGGHMCLFVGLQMMCTRDDTPGAMERTFGNFMVGNAVGQALGSGVISYFGGSAALPHAATLFTLATLICVIALIATLTIPAVPKVIDRGPAKPAVPVIEMMKVRGFMTLFFVSVVTVLTQDLLVVYLPLIGVERNISVDDIGLMLALRAGASIVARTAFAKIFQLLGGNRLLVLSTFIGSLSVLLLVLPIPLWLMQVSIAVSGFTLGIAVTVSIAASMALMTPETRGTALSIRMVGSRIAQFTVPFLVSLIAAVTGASGIFAVLGASMLASAAASQWRKPARR
jgi:predicted MFS family arabinose efflux permease